MPTIAEQLSEYTTRFRYEHAPDEVKRRARYLILDAAGIALAASTFDFSHRTVNALLSFGAGESAVIGMPIKLPLRDAVFANGSLIHGLDFDDTHLMGTIHISSSCFPTALAVAARTGKSTKDMLEAYMVGVETATRVGSVAKGKLNQIGFHPTGLVAAFGCALIAGKLYGLSEEQLTMAQGIVLSMASGAREYSSNSSGSKRLHPGWAGMAGITAAALARGGVTGPRTTYEGRFGLYAIHLGADVTQADMAAATADLGSKWETMNVALKPYSIGQVNIPFVDAAIEIAKKHPINVEDVESIEALVPQRALKVVCEPAERRKRPVDSYAAQFSIYYAVACAMLKHKFGLKELQSYNDPDILALAGKVCYRLDPNAGHTKGHWTGEVIVKLKNGKTVRHREEDARGSVHKPLQDAEIVAKYMGNALMAGSQHRAESIRDAVLAIGDAGSARDLEVTLSAA